MAPPEPERGPPREGDHWVLGLLTELHQIISWDFSSSFGNGQEAPSRKKRKNFPLVTAMVVRVGLMVACFAYLLVKKKSCEKRRKEMKNDLVFDASMEDKLAEGTGPRRFTYKEPVQATKNFSEEDKLGQGGFGGVYMGLLKGNPSSDQMVAVKRFSRGSTQGPKEYVSEVTIIGRLRHRNLVRLVG